MQISLYLNRELMLFKKKSYFVSASELILFYFIFELWLLIFTSLFFFSLWIIVFNILHFFTIALSNFCFLIRPIPAELLSSVFSTTDSGSRAFNCLNSKEIQLNRTVACSLREEMGLLKQLTHKTAPKLL